MNQHEGSERDDGTWADVVDRSIDRVVVPEFARMRAYPSVPSQDITTLQALSHLKRREQERGACDGLAVTLVVVFSCSWHCAALPLPLAARKWGPKQLTVSASAAEIGGHVPPFSKSLQVFVGCEPVLRLALTAQARLPRLQPQQILWIHMTLFQMLMPLRRLYRSTCNRKRPVNASHAVAASPSPPTAHRCAHRCRLRILAHLCCIRYTVVGRLTVRSTRTRSLCPLLCLANPMAASTSTSSRISTTRRSLM